MARQAKDVEPTQQTSSRHAFQEQATPALSRAALRYARQRTILVRRAGGRIDNLYPRELVQDALTDTWMGTVSWDPGRCSLLDHIRGLIRSRTWKDATGARRSPHLSVTSDTTAEVDTAWRHATTGSISPVVLAALTASVVRDLRRLADGDPAATAVLDAWRDGLIERDEVMKRTGLAERDYKAARARLAYLVSSLPQSLRETALTHLRSAS